MVIKSPQAVARERRVFIKWRVGINARAGVDNKDVHVIFFVHRETHAPLRATFKYRIERQSVQGRATEWKTG